MADIITKINALGFDTENTMDRFLNDEEFYIMCLEKVLDDSAFESLGENIKSGNAKEAFDNAHLLKGVVANVGATPLLEKIVEIVEPLREGKVENLDATYNEIIKIRDNIKAQIF